MKQSEAGFTLVELLAALVAGSLLLIGLSAMTTAVARQLGDTEARASDVERSASERIFVHLVENARPPIAGGADWSLSPERLRFSTLAPESLGFDREVRAVLEISQLPDGKAVSVRFEPLDARQLPAFATEATTLLTGLHEARFSVIQSEGGAAPMLAFEYAKFKGTTQRVTAVPRITSDPSCRFDPVIQACR